MVRERPRAPLATAAGAVLALTLLVTFAAAPAPGRQDPREEARRTDLLERTETRLVQLDVSVTGPPDAAAFLGREDFELKVHLRRLDTFEVDRHCTPPGETLSEGGPAVDYLFYFDQPLLTLPGRARAMDTARELVGRLVVDGSRAMIVSNASRLVVIEEPTADTERLLEALDRLEQDRAHWDFYATEESSRVMRVVEVLNEDDSLSRALNYARSFQREESARTERSLRRLYITLARLASTVSRKAVVYFADMLRQNPGEHYTSFFGPSVRRATKSVDDMASGAFSSGAVFDRMVNEAVAQGIRFYPVYAEGLVTPVDRERVGGPGLTRAGAMPSSSRVRFRDSQETLANMASETGGHAFLRGESPARIAGEVLEDFSCLYTLSFDPAGFPKDAPLRVVVSLRRDGLSLETRGRLVIQSESSRLATRLLTAFTGGSESDTDFGLRAYVVPTGYDRGRYAALLQVRAPGTGIPSASWQLGASLVGNEKVLDEVSATLGVDRAGVPVVLEREIAFRPGPHEIVAVAHESTLDFVLSEHVQLLWPDPDRRPVTCGPVALLQPSVGAFVRAGTTRSAGSLARADDEPVQTDLPTALMGLVCRSRRDPGPLRVERVLIGEAAVEFPSLEFELAGERCAQIRDLIPADSLGPGLYRYVLRALSGGKVLDEIARDFTATSPES
jgi:VWFA-related protein